jgi:hypothetical protein
MNVDEMRALIVECTSEAQRLINELHERDPKNETFSQVGLLDGADTVAEYLSHNEIAIALEHLLYMIHESDIRFDARSVVSLHSLAERLNIKNHYTASNLRALGVTSAHNIPDWD